MCTEQTKASTLRAWLQDPMIRLVMDSDGITQHEMIVLVRHVASAVASRPAPAVSMSQWHVQQGPAA